MERRDLAERTEKLGWGSILARLSFAALAFEAVSGLVITFGPFHPVVEWGVLVHTAVGVVTLLPIAWYLAVHWGDYRHFALSHVVLLGYVAVVALAVCAVSGLVVTWQGLLGTRMSPAWAWVHLGSTFALLATMLPHLVLIVLRLRGPVLRPVRAFAVWTLVVTVAGMAGTAALPRWYAGSEYTNEFPEDYVYLYGEDRPFAPSLARTAHGGALDPRALAGSETCGSSGCHTQILEEWRPSAHRYAAMDPAFQRIQGIMAEQNGAETTRYCGGCHDPISLFSGTKNVLVENLTGQHGYNEGVSCLACHAIRETDIQGNANYTVVQPSEYLWQWADDGPRKLARDFLIRTYPEEHARLSKRMFKAPEYCAACHKQFIDQEVNRVGWVQLQNQYDNWAASHWNTPGDATKTVECRECHMPLVASTDPAAGDAADYNRSPDDGMHRSHRFIAANAMIPAVLKLDGWETHVALTEKWLQGELEIPEIAEKWASGPIVDLALEVPRTVRPGQDIPIRVVLVSNKVGHDFPTGPLDIIQSWVEIDVTDESGRTVFHTGGRDEGNFLEPGTFLFKAEPVDQYGNLIDRHNLWEMVGVRFRRALFPGYSDSVDFVAGCPSTLPLAVAAGETPSTPGVREVAVPGPTGGGTYRVVARLNYRKVDQFLLNYMFGKESGLTAPVVELARAEAVVRTEATTGASGP